jgi:hypothetical protein
MVPGDRHPFLIETGRYPVEEVGPIHVVLDIFLAGPDDLDGAFDVLGDLDRANNTIDLQPPAKAAAPLLPKIPPLGSAWEAGPA